MISPKVWAMIIAASMLFGKSFVEAIIGQTIQSFFSSKGGPRYEEPVTPSHTAEAAPVAASQTSWSAPPIDQDEEEDPHQYAVQVYGTSSMIPSGRVSIRVLNSGSFGDVGYVFTQPQEAQPRKRKR